MGASGAGRFDRWYTFHILIQSCVLDIAKSESDYSPVQRGVPLTQQWKIILDDNTLRLSRGFWSLQNYRPDPYYRNEYLAAPFPRIQLPYLSWVQLKLDDGLCLSPAELQGFLLTRRKNPERALEEVEAWRAARLKDQSARSSQSMSFTHIEEE